MKRFFTFFILVFCITGGIIAAPVDSSYGCQPEKAVADTVKPVRFICRASSVRGGSTELKPLLVIDGIPEEFEKLKELKADDIDSIYIVKNIFASAIYGCRTSKGIIIITTKHGSARKFIIKDFLNGTDVPFATVCFTSKTDTIKAVADENGVLVTGKLKPAGVYQVTVSSAGYKTFSTIVKGKEQEILLEKDVRECAGVVVVGYPLSGAAGVIAAAVKAYALKGQDLWPGQAYKKKI
ncbi:MAG: hypothetical protein WDO16_13050 [Bacteroidota bacterium]